MSVNQNLLKMEANTNTEITRAGLLNISKSLGSKPRFFSSSWTSLFIIDPSATPSQCEHFILTAQRRFNSHS